MKNYEFTSELLALEGPLKLFARKFTSDDEDINDLTQETMLKAIKYRDKFEDNTNLKAWIFTIMRNTFINKYRRAVKANTLVDSTKELYYVNMPQQNDSIHPDSRYSEKEIWKEISALDEEYRLPFTMYFNGYKYKEIADQMDLPIGTVKSRIFLARQRLKDALKDFRYRNEF
ncbi:MAG: sigma-70 family RNA polymerase sigma factor [Luteibaculaceae bacterium]